MSLPSILELAPIVPRISRLQRGASRISADFYGKTGPFGLISAGFSAVSAPAGQRWRVNMACKSNPLHVSSPVATFHAINQAFILGVE